MVIRHVGAASTRGLLAHVRRPLGQALRLTPTPSPEVQQDEPPAAQSEQAVPEQAIPEQAVPEQTAAEQPVSEQAVPEQTIPAPVEEHAEQPATPPAVAEASDAAPAPLVDVVPGVAPAPDVAPAADVAPTPDIASVLEAVDQLAADMAQVRLGGLPPPAEPPLTDYQSIIAATIEALPRNTARKRREVYDHAFVIVHQRLSRTRPPLGSFAIAREELALERAIKTIEDDYAARFPDSGDDDDDDTPPVETTEYVALAAPVGETADFRDVGDAQDAAPSPLSAPPVRAPAARVRRKAHRPHAGLVLRTAGLAATIIFGVFGVWFATRVIAPQKPTAVAAVQPPASADSGMTMRGTDAGQAGAAAARPVRLPQGAGDDILSICQRAVSPNEFLLCSNVGIAPTGAGAVEQKLPFWVSTYHNAFDAPPQQRPSDTVVLPVANTAVPVARDRFESAMMRLRRDDIDRAITDLSEAIRADPQFADAYVHRGQSYFKNGDNDRAITDFSAALTIDSRHAAAYKSRGMAMLYKGDEEAAIRDLTSAIQYTDLDRTRLPAIEVFYARRSRAMLYDRRQQYDNEMTDLNAMIDGYWKNQLLVAALRLTYREQGLVSLMASIYRMRANVHVKRGNFDGAVADISFAMQLDPQRSLQLLLERARIQEGAGRRPQAAADFARALELSPSNEDARGGVTRLRGPV